MSNVATIENIKSLRYQLDAPYKDCVAALNENENDIDKASAWLKEKGKGDQRTAAVNSGAIGYYKGEDGISLVIVKCETDFVAINENFVKMVDELAKNLNLGKDDAVDTFKKSAWTFKENLEVGAHLNAQNGNESVVAYIHHNRSRASIVRYTGGNEEDARKIAMQVCSMNPSCVSRDDVDATKRAEIYDKAKNDALTSGKPENIAEKIADGKLNNALKDFVLLEQPMFDDAKSTVGQFAQKSGMTIIRFSNITV